MTDVDDRAKALADKDSAKEAFELRQFLKVKTAFGTRKDGRVYPKDELPELVFEGRTERLDKFESILTYFKELAARNNLPESYAYHLIFDLSNSSLRVRFKLTEQEADELKVMARAQELSGAK